MDEEIRGTYHVWQNSLLARKITYPSMVDRLNAIWDKASEAYPRATWQGWIDHSATHILSVLRNLDRLIPAYVYDDIGVGEAFVLIAATLLHDIGMVPRENDSTDLQYFANLRLNHGERATEIVRRNFRELLTPPEEILHPVCEIIKNHHGKFNPMPIPLSYDICADALWVRLADELDFGPHRAPSWLLDYIGPDKEQLEHWKTHNRIDEPSIDLPLFRIQVRGVVENEAFVRKLRAEFEALERQDLQRIFLGRGLDKQEHRRTFLIWDLTKITVPASGEPKGTDPRPTIFSHEQFFLGARYLYNLGRYDIAVKCFEEGVKRLPGRWLDTPAVPYFYHYLKSLHGLGEHRKAIEIAEQYFALDLPPEIRAAVLVANGLGYWKLGEFNSATSSFTTAATLYSNLSQRDIKHKVSEADAWVLYSIANLERLRASETISDQSLIDRIENGLNRADQLFLEYAREKPEVPESHYRGRCWGLRAFYCLLRIELDPQAKRNAEEWNDALRFAEGAYGGEELAHRNPFGAMCGKYCAAAVSYHKYLNCDNEWPRREALFGSAGMIRDVRKTYDDLFGPTARIPRLWTKIHHLFVQVREALPDESKRELSGFYGSDEPVQEVEIYTPLH